MHGYAYSVVYTKYGVRSNRANIFHHPKGMPPHCAQKKTPEGRPSGVSRGIEITVVSYFEEVTPKSG